MFLVVGLVASLGLVGTAAAASGNMNGPYVVSTGGKGVIKTFNDDYSSKGR